MDFDNVYFMKEALKEAKIAFDKGEVPVGAVIVRNNQIIAKGHNKRETNKNAIYHAEVDAINNACNILGGWRLWDCSLYVTLEPCPMCAGAIMNAHIPDVYFGAYDLKNGSCGSVTNLFELQYAFKPNCIGGILQDECSEIIKAFFKKLRNDKNTP
ncbi:MAG: nucleoside deaminase [Ruminococcus sp.]|nr:nucleoside deaminase [Ruminococcus sp.]